MDKNKLMVLDCETGGLDSSLQSILSFGAVILDGAHIVDEMHIFIAEKTIIAMPDALAVNHIDLEWLRANGLLPFDAVKQIATFVGKHFGKSPARIAGQNIAFDIGFLKRLFRLALGATWQHTWERTFHYRTHDTMHVLRFLGTADALPFADGGLDTAADFLGIDRGQFKPHDALDDAKLTAAVLVGLTNYVRDMARVYRGDDNA